MAEARGKFVWYDLMTTDVAAAAAFYGKVVGWAARDSEMPGQNYLLLSLGEDTLAGLMPVPEHAKGAHPAWMGYIGVDDVDAYTKKFKKAGGVVHREPWDVSGVGRISVVGDPQGAGVCLFTPKPKSQGMLEGEPNAPGRVGWHELHSSDGEAGFQFYSGMFGWTKDSEMDMGPMGKYHLFAYGERQVGGMMTKMADAPYPPMWLYYFNVEAIDSAVERIGEAGGKVLMGPHEVPGGMWIVQGQDPQGAMFALVATSR